MLKDLEKLEMWQISISADRGEEEQIGRDIQVTYKGKPIKGIQSLSMKIIKMKSDEGGKLLAEDAKLREV